MLVQEYSLGHIPIDELLQDIQYILDQDAERLKQNKSYYNRLHDNGKAKQEELEKFYNSLERDQRRCDFFSELIYRLQVLNMKMILAGINFCVESEKLIQGKEPEDYIITVRKEGHKFTTYYEVPKR